MSEGRLIAVVLSLMLVFFALLVSLFFLSSNIELRLLAQQQSEAVLSLAQGRGDVFDCNLEPLTSTTSKTYALAVTGEAAYADYFRQLAQEEQIKAYELYDQTTPYLLELEQPDNSNPFAFIDSERYLNEQIASNIIGYLDNSAAGAQGIEKAYNELLEEGGVKKSIYYDRDALGAIMMSTEPSLLHDYGTGQGIVLTIDKTIQRICEGIAVDSLPKGAIVVMEVQTGRIKAAVSTPMLYPNNILKNIEEDDGAFINRPASAYNVGSVIKPFIAAALIETGMDVNDTYECHGSIEVNGHRYSCFAERAHGKVDLETALAKSCNGYFIDKGIELSPQVLYDIGRDVGFGNAVMSDEYAVSEAGVLPTEEELENLGERASYSFGQGMIMATPIQITAAMNIFANDGVYIAPTLVEGVYNQLTDRMDESYYDPVIREVIPSDIAKEVSEMLKTVITEGTSDEAMPLFGEAAGKSGTAQTGRFISFEMSDEGSYDINEQVDETVAWFSGYYPAENPKYTITIMQEGSDALGEEMGEIFSNLCNTLRYFDSDLPTKNLKS